MDENAKKHINGNTGIHLPDSAIHLMQMFTNADYECFAVGGCIRDYLLGECPHDLDFTTNATVEEMKELFNANLCQWYPTGVQHGTLTVQIDKDFYEITTYRKDGEYSDGRHPDRVFFSKDLTDDLSRRDFTINAIAYSNETGIIDPYNGIDDLNNHIIRCVGSPNKRFTEDGLRIMRGIRFAIQLDFDIEPMTAKAIHDNLNMLDCISVERKTYEIIRMLDMTESVNIADKFSEYKDVLFNVIPELEPEDKTDQPSIYHDSNVFGHTMKVLANITNDASYLLRLAALFHDIGKPSCVSYDENGHWHTYKHDEVGAEITKQTMERMRFPNYIIDYVSRMVALHHMQISPTVRSVRRFIAKCGDPAMFYDVMGLRKADVLGHAPIAWKSPRSGLDCIDRIEEMATQQFRQNTIFSVKNLKINGDMLIAAGWEQGPEIGRALRTCLDKVIDGELENEKDTLLQYAIDIFGNTRSQKPDENGENI